MTLPTGPIYLSQVNDELGRPSTQVISMNDGALRSLAGQASGYVDMNSLRGKSAYTPMSGRGVDDTASGSVSSTSQTFYATASPSVVAANGTQPYSYQWTFINANGASFVGSTTAANCPVRHSVSKAGYIGTATLQCVVTDASGRTLTIQTVRATWDYQSSL